MNDHPPDLPEEPRELLGDALWDRLGQAANPAPVPAGFDAGLRAAIRAEQPWYRRHWVPLGAGVAGLAAAAAGLAIVLQPPPGVPDEPVPAPSAEHDLALVAELELVENMDLLQELDLLMAWDGSAP